MIYFLSLLCSMCVQFAAVGYGNIAPDYQYIVDDVQTNLSAGNSWQKTYARVSDELWYVLSQENGTYLLLFPREAAESNYSSSETVNSLIDDYGLNVAFHNYVFITWNGSVATFEWPTNRTLNIYYYTDDIISYPMLLYVGRESFYFDGEYQVNLATDEDVMVDVFAGIGSLSPSGHSSGDDPLQVLNNSGFNWGSMTGHSTGGASGPSPHSSSTHYTSTTPSPDSNDSKTDSLLYMIGNKLADITENTGAIGDALGGIMYNQVAGASAIFNAISAFNNNVVAAFTPPSQEDFSAILQTSELYLSYQSITACITSMTSTLNNVGQQSGYVWNIPLPSSWGGSLSFNFSNYLDSNTLSFVRTLIGALLIISTVVFVAHQLPDIIGGGSGGENA